MKEKDKKNPFKFSIDIKNWEDIKPSKYSVAFKQFEISYFINRKYSSLHKMYIHEKNEAEIAFEQIYKILEAFKIVDRYAPMLGMKLVKTAKKKTKPITGRTQRTTNLILKVQKDYNRLVHMKGMQPRKAKEILAKKYKREVSTINTYLNDRNP